MKGKTSAQSWACTCVSDAVNTLSRNQQSDSAEPCKCDGIIVPGITVVTHWLHPLSKYLHISSCPHASPTLLQNLVLIRPLQTSESRREEEVKSSGLRYQLLSSFDLDEGRGSRESLRFRDKVGQCHSEK